MKARAWSERTSERAGRGIFEFRFDQDAAQVLARKGKSARQEAAESAKILLRVFCHAHGDRIVLLLGGYDKGERPSTRHQQAQIELARARLRDWKVRRKPSGARLTIWALSEYHDLDGEDRWRSSLLTSWPS